MNVVRNVTAVTVRRHVILLHLPSMATVAGVPLVGTTERKIRLLRMVEFRLPPGRWRMACAAFLAESASMNVVARMAAGTGLGKLSFARRQLMTSGAARFSVCTGQCETALALVIEALLEPRVCLVAIGAAHTELPLVRIVDGMAGDAVTRGLLVVLRDMTSIAARVHMSARQRIFSFVMIEASLPPIQLVMTLATIIRKRALVCVILEMTTLTISRRSASRDLRQVASLARHVLMATE